MQESSKSSISKRQTTVDDLIITFHGLKKNEIARHNEYPTHRLVFEA